MSLDVHLVAKSPAKLGSGIFVRENGSVREVSRAEWDERFPGAEPVVAEQDDGSEVYWRNITHNLGKMADAAGIYQHLWRPDEIGVRVAGELIEPLTEGLERLRSEPDKYRALNPENGWGDYPGLVSFVEDYLDACRTHPTAAVEVSR